MHMPHNHEQPRRSFGRATVTEAMEADMDARIRAGALDNPATEELAVEAFRDAFRLTTRQAALAWVGYTNTRNR